MIIFNKKRIYLFGIKIVKVENPPINDAKNTLLYEIFFLNKILVVSNRRKSIHILSINSKSMYINMSPPFILY